MHEHDHPSRGRLPAAARQQISGAAFSALIAAAFMLFFGFVNPFLRVEGDSLLDASVVTFNSTMQYGGVLMLVSALVSWMGLRYALPFDAIVSGLIGLLLVFVGVVWIMRGQMTGYLLPIFALMFLHAARQNWLLHGAIMGGEAAGVHIEASVSHAPPVDIEAKAEARERLLDHLKQAKAGETPAPPPAPVAVPEPESEPEPGPEPPGGGFLAELGRDDDNKEKN